MLSILQLQFEVNLNSIDVDPHWSNADPNPDPHNLVNADPDPGRIQVNKTYFSKHLLILRSKKIF